MPSLPKWQNQRTNQIAEGIRDGDELIIRRARGSQYAAHGEPETQPGDLWHLVVYPRQAFIVTDVDHQPATLRSKRLRHLSLRVAKVTGSLTIRRRTEARNTFGRPTEGLETIVDKAPTAIIRETVANSPKGQDVGQPLAVRRRFLVSTETSPAQGDSATFYPPDGQTVELNILQAAQVAGNLWELELA